MNVYCAQMGWEHVGKPLHPISGLEHSDKPPIPLAFYWLPEVTPHLEATPHLEVTLHNCSDTPSVRPHLKRGKGG